MIEHRQTNDFRFGICGGFERLASAAGADYFEPPAAYAAGPEISDSDWRDGLERLALSGLRAEAWNCALPGSLKVVGPDRNAGGLEQHLAVVLPRLAETQAEILVFGAGGSRHVPDGYPMDRAEAEFAEAVLRTADLCAPLGIVVCVEALRRGETNLLNTVSETCRFVHGLAHVNVKVTADLYHMEADGEPLSSVAEAGGLIGHAHVADTGRRAPGTGSADFAGFLRALREGGYDGRVSIEAEWADYASEVGPALTHLREVASVVGP